MITQPPLAERLRDHLLKLIARAYDTPAFTISDDARKAVWSFIMHAEEAGEDVSKECRRYVDWLAYAATHRKTEYPPHTAETAALDIASHYGKACAWSKHKGDKSNALKPQPNRFLADDRPPEAIPTPEEAAAFVAELKARLAMVGQSN